MKNHEYRIVIIGLAMIAGIFYTARVGAQELAPGHKEVGLRLSSVNSFSIIYNKHKKEDIYRRWRFGAAVLGFSSSNSVQNFNLRANVAVGRERRRQISPNFDFIHGLEFIGSVGVQADDNRGSLNISPGIGFVFGFQYYISKSFYVGAELIPSISTSFTIDDNGFRDEFNLNGGFSSNSAALKFVYRLQG